MHNYKDVSICRINHICQYSEGLLVSLACFNQKSFTAIGSSGRYKLSKLAIGILHESHYEEQEQVRCTLQKPTSVDSDQPEHQQSYLALCCDVQAVLFSTNVINMQQIVFFEHQSINKCAYKPT